MDVLVVGDEFFGGVESDEGFAILSLALIEARQAEERSGLAGIVSEGFAEEMLGFGVLLQLRVEQAELFVIVGQIRLDGDVFAEFGFGPVVVFFLHVGESETKVDVG